MSPAQTMINVYGRMENSPQALPRIPVLGKVYALKKCSPPNKQASPADPPKSIPSPHQASNGMETKMSRVLVTGGSGFIGTHCILQLLAAGHEVRTTVRNLNREPDVRAMLKAGGADPGGQLSFFAADLENDAGWPQAVAGCDYVLHVASPFPANVPKNEDDLIIPAREGALRVLRASRDAGIKRVVLTSSFAAIGYGHPPQPIPFNETNWT